MFIIDDNRIPNRYKLSGAALTSSLDHGQIHIYNNLLSLDTRLSNDRFPAAKRDIHKLVLDAQNGETWFASEVANLVESLLDKPLTIYERNAVDLLANDLTAAISSHLALNTARDVNGGPAV